MGDSDGSTPPSAVFERPKSGLRAATIPDAPRAFDNLITVEDDYRPTVQQMPVFVPPGEEDDERPTVADVPAVSVPKGRPISSGQSGDSTIRDKTSYNKEGSIMVDSSLYDNDEGSVVVHDSLLVEVDEVESNAAPPPLPPGPRRKS